MQPFHRKSFSNNRYTVSGLHRGHTPALELSIAYFKHNISCQALIKLNQWVDGNSRITDLSDDPLLKAFENSLKPGSELWVGNWWGLFIALAIIGILSGIIIC